MEFEVLPSNLLPNNTEEECDFKNLNGALIDVSYVPNNTDNEDNSIRLSKFYFPFEQKYHPTY